MRPGAPDLKRRCLDSIETVATERRTSGFSGPGLALLAPAAEPGSSPTVIDDLLECGLKR